MDGVGRGPAAVGHVPTVRGHVEVAPTPEDVVLGLIPGIPKVHLHNKVLSPTLGGEEFLKPFRDAVDVARDEMTAERFERRHGFENDTGNADLVQGKRERKAADAGTGDQDRGRVHRISAAGDIWIGDGFGSPH